jgi:hypothetical protein
MIFGTDGSQNGVARGLFLSPTTAANTSSLVGLLC